MMKVVRPHLREDSPSDFYCRNAFDLRFILLFFWSSERCEYCTWKGLNYKGVAICYHDRILLESMSHQRGGDHSNQFSCMYPKIMDFLKSAK